MIAVKDWFDVAGYVVEAAGVLIRSYLTMTLELEIERCWPWQQSKLKG